MHEDFCVGEQFLGASLGYTLVLFNNVSVLTGAGYDFDKNRFESFIGFSSRSLFGIGALKLFNGYDIAINRIRSGLGYELYKVRNWSLDVVGTAQIFNSRNFIGLNLGYDIFEGQGGGGKHPLEANLGGFVGYSFDSTEKHVGAGISFDLRF